MENEPKKMKGKETMKTKNQCNESAIKRKMKREHKLKMAEVLHSHEHSIYLMYKKVIAAVYFLYSFYILCILILELETCNKNMKMQGNGKLRKRL